MEKRSNQAKPNPLEELNKKYFVATVGGKVLVCYVEEDPEAKRKQLKTYTFTDFRNRWYNRYIKHREDNVRLGNAWLGWSNRRQYDRVVFYPYSDPKYNRCPPDCYNLWRGFAVDPKQGDWPIYKEHLLKVVCNGDENLFNYLIRWMAYFVQHPDEQGYVAIAMRGEKGSGKTIAAEYFGGIFGQHSLTITNPQHLTGHFNGHLRDVLFLFVDEGFWAGDKEREGVLKSHITSPDIVIEDKGKNPERYPNRLHIWMATNSSWQVPASGRERRFFCLDVSSHRIGDREYFKNLAKEMKEGGREALLYDLLRMDLSDFNITAVPDTDALLEQKVHSMDPLTSYYFHLLQVGAMPKYNVYGQQIYGCDWTLVVKDDFYKDYVQKTRLEGVRRPGSIDKVGMEIRKLLPKPYPKNKRDRSGGNDIQQWIFPPLDACRTHFLKVQGINGYNWDQECVADQKKAVPAGKPGKASGEA